MFIPYKATMINLLASNPVTMYNDHSFPSAEFLLQVTLMCWVRATGRIARYQTPSAWFVSKCSSHVVLKVWTVTVVLVLLSIVTPVWYETISSMRDCWLLTINYYRAVILNWRFLRSDCVAILRDIARHGSHSYIWFTRKMLVLLIMK